MDNKEVDNKLLATIAATYFVNESGLIQNSIQFNKLYEYMFDLYINLKSKELFNVLKRLENV